MKKIFKLITLPLVALSVLPNAIVSTSCSNYENLFFTVSENKLEVTFCDRGAAIYNMKYDGQEVTYQPQDKTAFVNPNREMYHFGKTVGRVFGRIKDGKFDLDGKTYNVEINETASGKNNCLHGGNNGLCFKDFKHYVSKDSTGTTVCFNYLSPANEAGFPETVDIWVIYKLHNESSQLDMTIYAVPTGRTIIDITNHTYFKLGKCDNIRNHYLTIPAKQMAKFDETQTIVGLEDVKPYWDFNTRKLIGQDLDKAAKADPMCNGYDNGWKFNDADRYLLLENPESKISLRVQVDDNDSTTTAVNCYVNCYPAAGLIMNDGKANTQYGSIAIEPETFHTTTDLSPIIYSPEKPFFRKILYKFDTLK